MKKLITLWSKTWRFKNVVENTFALYCSSSVFTPKTYPLDRAADGLARLTVL